MSVPPLAFVMGAQEIQWPGNCPNAWGRLSRFTSYKILLPAPGGDCTGHKLPAGRTKVGCGGAAAGGRQLSGGPWRVPSPARLPLTHAGLQMMLQGWSDGPWLLHHLQVCTTCLCWPPPYQATGLHLGPVLPYGATGTAGPPPALAGPAAPRGQPQFTPFHVQSPTTATSLFRLPGHREALRTTQPSHVGTPTGAAWDSKILSLHTQGHFPLPRGMLWDWSLGSLVGASSIPTPGGTGQSRLPWHHQLPLTAQGADLHYCIPETSHALLSPQEFSVIRMGL